MNSEFRNDALTSIKLSEEEQRAIRALNAIKSYKKGTVLLEEGQIPTTSFYILKGCVRQFYILDGEEKTTFFYTEEQTIQGIENRPNSTPSKFNLECIEDCEITCTTFEQEEEMYQRFPRFQELCRKASEKELLAYQELFAQFILATPEQRYLNIMQNRPDLLNRVPQYQLASYIGIAPESLSRIRRRIASKK